ncbi:hypothetical protein DRP77_06375 [Candidatus Poribacteria bacterium]|nr:MAG: hypothetical protein DRP77_06375 [Candidatus Poribacteria bacterium]
MVVTWEYRLTWREVEWGEVAHLGKAKAELEPDGDRITARFGLRMATGPSAISALRGFGRRCGDG